MTDQEYANSIRQNLYSTPSVTATVDPETGEAVAENGASKASMLSALQAKRARDENMAALNNSYNTRKNALADSYKSSLNSLASDYKLSNKNINDTAAGNLKQAYINNMMGQKNLKQKMSAQGLTGGATESTLARLINAYGNNRNTINTQKAKDLSSLENAYTNNKNNALQTYNNALANLEADQYQQRANIENTYYGNVIQAIQDYVNSGEYSEGVLDSALAMAANKMGYYGNDQGALNNYALQYLVY